MADPVLFSLTAENGFSLQTSALQEAITIGKSAHYELQAIMNRSAPVVTYADSSVITVGASLKFVALGTGIGTGGLSVQDVNNIGKGLMSLTFPVSSGIEPPPLCYLTIGAGTIIYNLPFVCSECSLRFSEMTFDTTGDPYVLSASLTFLGIDFSSVDSKDWGAGALSAYSQLTF